MSGKFQKVFGEINREISLEEFQKFVLASSSHQGQLFEAIRDCRTQGFPRFNIWRMLLEVIPIQADWQQKKETLELSRKRWVQAREQANNKVAEPSTPTKQTVHIPKNPLMMMSSKPEKKKEEPQYSLSQEIKKDLNRTYQEMSFFEDKQIQKLLADVLYVWCKINPDVSYKQGMNEVLASIVYVYFQEAVPDTFQTTSQIQEKYLHLNSISHAEADVYIIFEKIMSIQKDMFKEYLDEQLKGSISPNSKNNTPILQRIVALQDKRLKSVDLQLFRVLKLQNIQDSKTRSFLLRWIRCMHTREFGLFNSLFIWDSIFLDAFESPNSKNKKQYEFMDAMCLAMFIYMRAVVLTRETANEILQIYSKYPMLEGQYLFELIRLAWSVCEELRNQISNPASNSNWYEDSAKVRKLGLMGSKPEGDKRKPHQADHVYDREAESPTTPTAQNNGQAHDKKDVISKSMQSSPSRNEASPCAKGSRCIDFQERQIRDLMDTLQESINLNTDVHSKSIACKVLKALEAKLKQ